MQRIYKYCLLAAVALMLAACTEFLSELPTKGTNQPISSLEQMEGLLYGIVTTSSGYFMETCPVAVFSTDDCHLPLDYCATNPTRFAWRNVLHYIWDIENLPDEATDPSWSNQFSLINRANTVLYYVDKVPGDPAKKAQIKAQAHFHRAYCYWYLANYYCLPYAPENMQEQGTPRKLTINNEEDYSHMTLEETYKLIDADIAEALKVDIDAALVTWQADKATVNAFLSRYYLHRGEYDKAIEAADYALANKGNVSLKDYNTLVAGNPAYYTNPLDTIRYCETNNYTNDQIQRWQELFLGRFAYAANQWMVPSPALIALYDGNSDMRYKWFMHPNGHRRFTNNISLYRYTMFSDGRYAWSGPTIQEVMLNKAECLLRKSSPDIAGALAIVNNLRDHRIAPGTPGIHLTAATRDEALVKVLEERRRELPFGHRWWDIRRFSVTETTVDKVAITRIFYVPKNGEIDFTQTKTYMLPVGSRRYAVPIFQVDIDASEGKLKQNTY